MQGKLGRVQRARRHQEESETLYSLALLGVCVRRRTKDRRWPDH